MSKQHPDKTEAARRADEGNAGDLKERMAGALGGALSRIFERAGLDVRVLHQATPPSDPAAAPPAGIPGRDALLTVATAVLAERLLAVRSTAGAPAHPPARLDDAAPAGEPAPPAVCDRISDLLGPAVVDPTARPAPRAAAPAITPPLPSRQRTAAAEPASGAPAVAASPAPAAAPASAKPRGFTLRY